MIATAPTLADRRRRRIEVANSVSRPSLSGLEEVLLAGRHRLATKRVLFTTGEVPDELCPVTAAPSFALAGTEIPVHGLSGIPVHNGPGHSCRKGHRNKPISPTGWAFLGQDLRQRLTREFGCRGECS